MSRTRFSPALIRELRQQILQQPLAEQIQTLRGIVPRTSRVLLVGENWNFARKTEPAVAQWFDWERSLASGRSYLVGESMTRPAFLRSHRSSCTLWQQLACLVAWQRPQVTINVACDFPPLDYDVYWRGEYVEIALPHQDHGGEKHWIARHPFKTKILVNVD